MQLMKTEVEHDAVLQAVEDGVLEQHDLPRND